MIFTFSDETILTPNVRSSFLMNALSIKDLQKTYKTGVVALKNLNLDVKEGSFFGLLGPNGAGKSTTIGIVSGLVNKTAGSVHVFGIDAQKDTDRAKELVGIVPQEMNFNIFEKVEDIVVDQAGYYGVPKKIAEKRAEKYLKQLGLWDKRHVASRTLSGGMKRRLLIARGLIHEPKLLILDEPTAGVDVELRRGMWDFLKELHKKGITIILTTHYLEEAEMLCDHIAIINKGELIEYSTKKSLLAKLDKTSYLLDVTKPIEKLPHIAGFTLRQVDDLTMEVELSQQHDLHELFRLLEKEGIKIASLRNKTNRLEELFVSLTEGETKGGKK